MMNLLTMIVSSRYPCCSLRYNRRVMLQFAPILFFSLDSSLLFSTITHTSHIISLLTHLLFITASFHSIPSCFYLTFLYTLCTSSWFHCTPLCSFALSFFPVMLGPGWGASVASLVKGSSYEEGLHLVGSRRSYTRDFLGKGQGFKDTS